MTDDARLTRDEQKARTRLTVQSAALDLFEAQGYHQTTIDQIADAAGIGRRTFFRYFPSKEAVLFGDGRLSAFDGLIDALDAALAAGRPALRSVLDILESAPVSRVEPSAVAVRRRRARAALLDDPGVSAYYRGAVADLAREIAATVRRYPQGVSERYLPELVGGLVNLMLVEHVDSGETVDFRTDSAPWRAALRAAAAELADD